MTYPAFVVQAEFFHLDMSKPIKEMMSQGKYRIASRQQDIRLGLLTDRRVGTGLKTCVRFYDDDGSVERVALRAIRLTQRIERVFDTCVEARGIKHLMLSWIYRLLRRKQVSSERKRRAFLVETFRKKVILGEAFAVEQWDHRFRPAGDDERYVILAAIQHSHHVWIFMFDHEDLLADQNRLYLSVMI